MKLRSGRKFFLLQKEEKASICQQAQCQTIRKLFFPLVQNETSEFISQFLFFFDFNSSLCEFLCCFLQDFLLSKSIDGVTESILRPLKLQAAP